MAGNVQDTLRELLVSAIQGAGQSSGGVSDQLPGKSDKGHSGARGLAAGVGAVALAPLAFKGMTKLARQMGFDELQDVVKSPGQALQGITSGVGDHVGSKLGDKVSEKVDDAGGASGIVSDAVKGALPFGGGDDDGGGGSGDTVNLGVGKGRRMPIQQSVDIGVPRETVYNQWTQFEDWPNFMHRVTRVSQDEDTTVTFATKIWGKTKEFTAEIETQRPDERIQWKVSQGITHAGVVTFHELAPNLTRVLLTLDVAPGSMLEKLARGARHIKRGVRGDLHRFKAFIEMLEHETGAWRGVIEDGEVIEEHDASYDEDREYSDPQALLKDDDDQDSDDAQNDEGDDEDEEPKAQRPRRRKQSANGHRTDEESSQPRRGRSSGGRSQSRSRSSGNGNSGGSRSSRRTSQSSSSSRRSRSRGSDS